MKRLKNTNRCLKIKISALEDEDSSAAFQRDREICFYRIRPK